MPCSGELRPMQAVVMAESNSMSGRRRYVRPTTWSRTLSPPGGRLVAGVLKEADVTTDPNPDLVRDLSARNDIEALRRTLPVVKDIKDYAVPEFFERDEEFEDFQHMLEADRQADLA